MTTAKILALTAFAASTFLLPLAAQTPLFNDGTAFGGSRVFSEGREGAAMETTPAMI